MGPVLPDTSIWVEYLRKGKHGEAANLDGLLAAQEVRICGPVLAEVLAGTAEHDREAVTMSLGALPWSHLDQAGWVEVGIAAADLRRKGEAVPLTDIEIGVAAARAGATLWTRDRDFERVQQVVPGLDLRGLE